MGWTFPVEHVNLVAYLTNRDPASKLPRTSWHELLEFLTSLSRAEPSSKHQLISSHPNWIDQIRVAADESRGRILGLSTDNGLVEPNLLRSSLRGLHGLFSSFSLYGLILSSSPDDSSKLDDFIQTAVLRSPRGGLFLRPHYSRDSLSLKILDPFPGISMVAEHPERWPGVLFWSDQTKPAFFELVEAYKFLLGTSDQEMTTMAYRRAKDGPSFIGSNRPLKIIHLSDFHFGTEYATKHERYLLSHLGRVAPHSDRIIITGDVVDTPSDTNAAAFTGFFDQLSTMTKKSPILIPGNHDSKVKGNLRTSRSLREYIAIEWDKLVIDDDIKCAFIGFDSSIDAKTLARGIVDDRQLRAVGTKIEEAIAKNNVVNDYLQIALIHHHPFSFDLKAETWIQKFLAPFGGEEKVLKMVESEKFIQWCARRKVSLILHGHKHAQRHVEKTVKVNERGQECTRNIVSIGCGTSLGAEAKPLTYNILTWSPKARQWSVAFYESLPDASGFEQQMITIHRIE